MRIVQIDRDTLAKLIDLVRKRMPTLPPDFGLDETTAVIDEGLGLDSIGAFELIVACDDAFGIELPEETLEKDLTLGVLARLIREEQVRMTLPS